MAWLFRYISMQSYNQSVKIIPIKNKYCAWKNNSYRMNMNMNICAIKQQNSLDTVYCCKTAKITMLFLATKYAE